MHVLHKGIQIEKLSVISWNLIYSDHKSVESFEKYQKLSARPSFEVWDWYRPGATDEYIHPIFITSADPILLKVGVGRLWNEWSAAPYPVGPGATGGPIPRFGGSIHPISIK